MIYNLILHEIDSLKLWVVIYGEIDYVDICNVLCCRFLKNNFEIIAEKFGG